MCCASEAIGGDPLPQSLSLVASCSCKTAVTHRIRYYSWLCLFRNSLLEAYSAAEASDRRGNGGREKVGSRAEERRKPCRNERQGSACSTKRWRSCWPFRVK